jgi:hypothetical protein
MSFSLFLSILLQNGSVPVFPPDTFTEKETAKIEKKADNIDGRIDVYRSASERMQKELKKTLSKEGFQYIPDRIERWTLLVTESLKDIKANIDPGKKKSKSLIKYEIQVRKAIKDLKELQVRAPYSQQDMFDNCIERADVARGKMVDILFLPEKTRD